MAVFNWKCAEIITINGKDAPDFLQRLSTANFKKNDFPIWGSFLTGTGKLISVFTSWRDENGCHFFIEPPFQIKTFEYLNQMHFAENLTISKSEAEVYEFRNEKKVDGAVLAYNWGQEGYYLINPKKEFKLVDEYEFDQLRASHGYPKLGRDLSEDNVLIECSHFESFIDRNKGCYPGQEVIEKIYTYGRISQKVVKVQITNKTKITTPQNLFNSTKEKVGVLTSVYFSQSSIFGIATLKRFFIDKKENFLFEVNGESFSGTIV